MKPAKGPAPGQQAKPRKPAAKSEKEAAPKDEAGAKWGAPTAVARRPAATAGARKRAGKDQPAAVQDSAADERQAHGDEGGPRATAAVAKGSGQQVAGLEGDAPRAGRRQQARGGAPWWAGVTGNQGHEEGDKADEAAAEEELDAREMRGAPPGDDGARRSPSSPKRKRSGDGGGRRLAAGRAKPAAGAVEEGVAGDGAGLQGGEARDGVAAGEDPGKPQATRRRPRAPSRALGDGDAEPEVALEEDGEAAGKAPRRRVVEESAIEQEEGGRRKARAGRRREGSRAADDAAGAELAGGAAMEVRAEIKHEMGAHIISPKVLCCMKHSRPRYL